MSLAETTSNDLLKELARRHEVVIFGAVRHLGQGNVILAIELFGPPHETFGLLEMAKQKWSQQTFSFDVPLDDRGRPHKDPDTKDNDQ